MPSLSRYFKIYLYDQIKTASTAPLLLVAHLEHVGFRGMYGSYLYCIQHTHARAHATISSPFCSERVLILSILGLMKLHVDIHVIHALSLKMNLILLACIVAWLGSNEN